MRRALAVVVALGFFVLGQPAGASAPRQVLVRFVDGASASAVSSVLRDAGVVRTGSVYGTDVLVARGVAGSAEALSAVLERSPLVDYAEPDHVLSIHLANPNDPRFGDQYAHQRIESVAGWSVYPGSYTSSGSPTIAVLDTGIDSGHEDLSGRLDKTNSRCFLGLLCLVSGYEDDNGHGTHVSGIAAATTNNSRGIAGVAFNSRVMALKVCNAVGLCDTSAAASALNWARERGAKVASMSFGGSGSSNTLRNAVQAAHASGMVLVAAAGNDGDDTLNYPAAYPEVISVAATDSSDRRASYSNENDDVELAAPGSGVLSTYLGGGYTSLSGTSMAAPHVSGLAALLFGQNPSWSNQQVRDRMAACADDLGDAGRDPAFGFGRIDLGRALGSC